MADISFHIEDNDDEGRDDQESGDNNSNGEEEKLTPFGQLQKCANSNDVWNRQMVGRILLQVMRDASTTSVLADLPAIMNLVETILTVDATLVRTELIEQIPQLAMVCMESNIPEMAEAVSKYLLPLVVNCFKDSDAQVRKTSQATLLVLMEDNLISKKMVEIKVCPTVLQISYDCAEDKVAGAVNFMSKMAPLLGKDTTEHLFLRRFSELCSYESFAVRRICAASIGEFCAVVGTETYEKILLPRFVELCADDVWGVRKCCAEVVMSVSCACPPYLRRAFLAPAFEKLLNDQSRWVRMAAFQNLGPFISTFANPRITGLAYNQTGELVIINPKGTEFRLNSPAVTDSTYNLTVTLDEKYSNYSLRSFYEDLKNKKIFEMSSSNNCNSPNTSNFSPLTNFLDEYKKQQDQENITSDDNDTLLNNDKENEQQELVENEDLDLVVVTKTNNSDIEVNIDNANMNTEDDKHVVKNIFTNVQENCTETNNEETTSIHNNQYCNVSDSDSDTDKDINVGSGDSFVVTPMDIDEQQMEVVDNTQPQLSDSSTPSTTTSPSKPTVLPGETEQTGFINENFTNHVHLDNNKDIKSTDDSTTKQYDINKGRKGRWYTFRSLDPKGESFTFWQEDKANKKKNVQGNASSSDVNFITNKLTKTKLIKTKLAKLTIDDKQGPITDNMNSMDVNNINSNKIDNNNFNKNQRISTDEKLSNYNEKQILSSKVMQASTSSNSSSIKNNCSGQEKDEDLEKYNSHQYWYITPSLPLDMSIVEAGRPLSSTVIQESKKPPTAIKLYSEVLKAGDKEKSDTSISTITENNGGGDGGSGSGTGSGSGSCSTTSPPALNLESPKQHIVPQLLIDHYISMTDPTLASSTDSELSYHCAYSFPAVALTLGREHWEVLCRTYSTLATDFQWKVRRAVAESLHEVATILGESLATEYLAPIFDDLIKDVDIVRIGILKHMAYFLKLIHPQRRNQYLPRLSEFLITDTVLYWRFRCELASQLLLSIPLWTGRDAAFYIMPLAMELLQDKVAAVRSAAVLLVSELIHHIKSDYLNKKAFAFDLAHTFNAQFAHSKSWIRRQTFADLCAKLVSRYVLPPETFARDFMPHFLDLSWDPVANVRLAVARTLANDILKNEYFADPKCPDHENLTKVLKRLQSDKDRDVRHAATFQN